MILIQFISCVAWYCRKIGLGNGKKRSQQYENYVLMQRQLLRVKYNLCESLTQRILGYSNNFLHKRLLTEQNRTRLKGATKELTPVTMLWKKKCCRDQCVAMSRTHINLLVKWRQLAESGQRGLQQSVAELLTPTAGAKTNCYKFISLVTGSSPATIAKISKMIKKNGGVLGLQEHGKSKQLQVVKLYFPPYSVVLDLSVTLFEIVRESS